MALKGLKGQFSRMQKAYEKNDKIRDQVIILSRDIRKPSKQAIYALHRNEMTKAITLLKSAKATVEKVEKLLKNYDAKDVGAYNAALEEYVEAHCYLSFLMTGNFPTAKQLGVQDTEYLLGLADCTGELARRAVKLAIEDNEYEIRKIHSALEELSELFLEIEFRGIDMRKKLEGLKYNLAKTENILYDLKLKRR